MPEHRTLLRKQERDSLCQAKPVLDEYQIEEFENRICEAMEYKKPVVITILVEGFTYEEKGSVHYIDPIKKEIRIQSEEGVVVWVQFADIIGVEVVDE